MGRMGRGHKDFMLCVGTHSRQQGQQNRGNRLGLLNYLLRVLRNHKDPTDFVDDACLAVSHICNNIHHNNSYSRSEPKCYAVSTKPPYSGDSPSPPNKTNGARSKCAGKTLRRRLRTNPWEGSTLLKLFYCIWPTIQWQTR
jgi:hypothetical protein